MQTKFSWLFLATVSSICVLEIHCSFDHYGGEAEGGHGHVDGSYGYIDSGYGYGEGGGADHGGSYGGDGGGAYVGPEEHGGGPSEGHGEGSYGGIESDLAHNAVSSHQNQGPIDLPPLPGNGIPGGHGGHGGPDYSDVILVIKEKTGDGQPDGRTHLVAGPTYVVKTSHLVNTFHPSQQKHKHGKKRKHGGLFRRMFG